MLPNLEIEHSTMVCVIPKSLILLTLVLCGDVTCLTRSNRSGRVQPRVRQLSPDIRVRQQMRGAAILKRNDNGDEKFWGGTEVVLSPEGDGKLPVIAEDKDPYHDIVHSGGMPPFVKRNLLQLIVFFMIKMLLVFPMKVGGLFLLVSLSGFVGFIALMASAALFGFMGNRSIIRHHTKVHLQ